MRSMDNTEKSTLPLGTRIGRAPLPPRGVSLQPLKHVYPQPTSPRPSLSPSGSSGASLPRPATSPVPPIHQAPRFASSPTAGSPVVTRFTPATMEDTPNIGI